jgi:hypothetical protein
MRACCPIIRAVAPLSAHEGDSYYVRISPHIRLSKALLARLVYDLMECARGAVDGLVLDFLAYTTFHAGDFTRVSDGSCRLHPQLARAVVAGCRLPQQQIDEEARWLASMLSAERKAKLESRPVRHVSPGM